MPANPLAAEQLLESLNRTLPTGASVKLACPQDALAALSHTVMAALGFRLINLGEQNPVAPPSEGAEGPHFLPASWNAAGPDLYTFGYRHEQSSLEFVVKLVKVAARMLVTASAVEHNRTAVWEITTGDFTSESFFPYTAESAGGGGASALVNGFISIHRAQDFANEFNTRIVQQILPGLQKEGYQPASGETASESSRSRPARETGQEPPPGGQPVRPAPTQPRAPPRFGDDPDDPTLPGPPYAPAPIGVGQRDLDPFAANPLPLPGRGGFGGSFAPPPLFGGGGGMLVGPDDPLFRTRFPPTGPAGTGLPPGAVPPGANFDPIFPGGQRFPQGPGRGPGRGGRAPLGGDPDFDDFPPPRNSDYDNMFG